LKEGNFCIRSKRNSQVASASSSILHFTKTLVSARPCLFTILRSKIFSGSLIKTS
ncbi:unnamed protein product, partial [Arabidopsis halleri]